LSIRVGVCGNNGSDNFDRKIGSHDYKKIRNKRLRISSSFTSLPASRFYTLYYLPLMPLLNMHLFLTFGNA